MVEVVEITKAEADLVIAFEEGHYGDVKAKEIGPGKLSQSISAFANTAGGEVYVGIPETKKGGARIRTWNGFAAKEDANDFFSMLEEIGHLGNHYNLEFLKCTDYPGLVLHITVFKTVDIIRATDGIPYIRRNASKLPVNTDEKLKRLQLDKGIVSYEDQTVKVPGTVITASATAKRFMKNVVPRSRPANWMKNQFLITGDNPTVAGLLLFADEPQAALAGRSAVKIYRYKTRAAEGNREVLAGDPITIEGCAYDLIYRSVAKTKELIEELKQVGQKGLEAVRYPDETLHEVVTNAILHRDYSIAADVHIRIFDNRIEVESPGKLPGYVTVKNILGSQSHRNPKIVRLINKFPNPPNKDVGEGLNTAFAAMKSMRLREPAINESDTAVTVVINHAPLASPEDSIMEYLITHQEITNKIARELTGIKSENTVKECFIRLKNAGQIERVPGKLGNKSSWRKVV